MDEYYHVIFYTTTYLVEKILKISKVAKKFHFNLAMGIQKATKYTYFFSFKKYHEQSMLEEK